MKTLAGEEMEYTLGVLAAVSLETVAVEDKDELPFRVRFGEVLGERRLKVPESMFKVSLIVVTIKKFRIHYR